MILNLYKVIKQGNHYCTPFPLPKIKFGNGNIKRQIKFGYSCRYDFKDNDQYDINKLFGISYGYHHYNSDRIGWRYDVEKNKIELLTYSYVNGVRIKSNHICYVECGELFNTSISWKIQSKKRIVTFQVNDVIITKTYKVSYSWFKYTLGLYFGGNRTAPYRMIIYYK